MARVCELCFKLYLHRHLLEQPPPHDARGATRKWQRALGQFASFILAVARAFCVGLDGRKSFYHLASSCVWFYSIDECYGIQHFIKAARAAAWRAFYLSRSCRHRP